MVRRPWPWREDPDEASAALPWPGFESDFARVRRAAGRCRADYEAVCAGLLGVIEIVVRPRPEPQLLGTHDVDVEPEHGFDIALVIDGRWDASTWIGAAADEEVAAYIMVDLLSGDLTEALALRSIQRARHWPKCRGHEHSMLLQCDDDGAYWQCPSDAAMRVSVGNVASLIG